MKVIKLGLIIGLVILLCGIVMPVSAENNGMNVTNVTNQTWVLGENTYDTFEQYYEQFKDWYKIDSTSQYYQPYLDAVNGTLQPTITKQDVINCLFQDKSDEDLHNDELALMGMTDKLERFINAEKEYIEETGEWAIWYEYSFFDNLASFFGNKPDVYTDYYEAKLAEMQYNTNLGKYWIGEKSKHLLLLEENTDE